MERFWRRAPRPPYDAKQGTRENPKPRIPGGVALLFGASRTGAVLPCAHEHRFGPDLPWPAVCFKEETLRSSYRAHSASTPSGDPP